MARVKSEQKRGAILAAATSLFAARGPVATPTAAIAREAGVAEGTLFTYFSSKDDLVAALHQRLRADLDAAVMSDFPNGRKPRRRLHHVWKRYIHWGLGHPEGQRVLRQLDATATPAAPGRESGSEASVMVRAAMDEALRCERIRRALPPEFLTRSFFALATATLEFVALDPPGKDAISEAFALLWTGATHK